MSARTIADKVIIVTGASSGIGRATAMLLAREKARLVVVARREALLATLEADLRLTLDLRDRSQVETMITATMERFGRIDVLINNAGFGYRGTVEETPPAVVREIFDLNFEAPLFASQLVIPIMKAQGRGHIINVSSVVGRRALPFNGIYCATKFALQGISESLRVEVKDAGIDVSIVSPDATESEFGDHVRRGEIKARFKATSPVQTSEEVARFIVDCIRNPKLEVYPSRRGRFFAWVSVLSPGIVDRILANHFKDSFRAFRKE